MATIFSVVAPVFLIIGFGYWAVRLGAFAREGVRFIMSYAHNFAVPLLLFDAMRKIDFAREFRLDILAGYFVPALIVFALGYGAGRRLGRGSQASVVLGFNAYFSNALLMGLPLAERAFGADSLSTNFTLLAVHAPIGYLTGAIGMELARPGRISLVTVIKGALRDWSRNPLILGIFFGLMFNWLDLRLPEVIADAVAMQSQAALPVALFGLGGVLTGLVIGDQIRRIFAIGFLRLMLFPSLVFVFAGLVLNIENSILRNMILMACLPTGVNGFIFASLYDRENETAASIVVATTMASMISVPIWLMIIYHFL